MFRDNWTLNPHCEQKRVTTTKYQKTKSDNSPCCNVILGKFDEFAVHWFEDLADLRLATHNRVQQGSNLISCNGRDAK